MCRVVARPLLRVLVCVCWCVCAVAVAGSAGDLRSTHTGCRRRQKESWSAFFSQAEHLASVGLILVEVMCPVGVGWA